MGSLINNKIILFSVFTVTPSKIRMQTIQCRMSRIWEIKKTFLCDISYARCSEKHLTQIYKALYGDAECKENHFYNLPFGQAEPSIY